MRKWYQDWRSWITILLLFFVPTFIIGIIIMWAAAPWGRKAKWWVTGIGIGLPLLAIVVTFLLATISPIRQSSVATDATRRADVQQLTSQAHQFCLDVGRCPESLYELQQRGYVKVVPIDPVTKADFYYQSTSSGKDCMIKATLSSGETYAETCFSGFTQ